MPHRSSRKDGTCEERWIYPVLLVLVVKAGEIEDVQEVFNVPRVETFVAPEKTTEASSEVAHDTLLHIEACTQVLDPDGDTHHHGIGVGTQPQDTFVYEANNDNDTNNNFKDAEFSKDEFHENEDKSESENAKFDRSIFQKVTHNAENSLQDIAKLEPDKITPPNQTTSAVAPSFDGSGTQIFGRTTTLKKFKKKGSNSSAPSGIYCLSSIFDYGLTRGSAPTEECFITLGWSSYHRSSGAYELTRGSAPTKDCFITPNVNHLYGSSQAPKLSRDIPIRKRSEEPLSPLPEGFGTSGCRRTTPK
nr:hypothetical protein [Tanacetum cinerariifolium]GEX09544.1 hypothetical protein [Tanacetum cinerariifolium]